MGSSINGFSKHSSSLRKLNYLLQHVSSSNSTYTYHAHSSSHSVYKLSKVELIKMNPAFVFFNLSTFLLPFCESNLPHTSISITYLGNDNYIEFCR